MSTRVTMLPSRSPDDVLEQLKKQAAGAATPLDRRVAALMVQMLPPLLRDLDDHHLTGPQAVSLVVSLISSLVGSVAALHLPRHVAVAFAETVLEEALRETTRTLTLHAMSRPSDMRPS